LSGEGAITTLIRGDESSLSETLFSMTGLPRQLVEYFLSPTQILKARPSVTLSKLSF